jgi:3-oxoacyl-(acyl-carrier-protein) synthase
MCGRFPGASDLDAFWENLKSGKDSITEIPKSRWDWQAIYGDPGNDGNKTNIKWGGFIEGVDEFDPLFFNISPREAVSMDPQQRLLMTYTWRAIEDAGYPAQSLSGTKTAIFVGTASTGYSELVAQAGPSIEGHDATSGLPSIGPNRMSYLLNLHGPSEPIETACSSSLVAIHRAVRAMQSGDCEMALAGGIQTIITPWAHISFGRAGMLCEDGRCKTFSKDANGYVRGEGVGMLFLKKLSAAERDGDHIYGLIKGSSENHGGRANSLTAPNPKAQAELLKAAYREAKIDPRTVSYIETHGTGTPLGDPIEINGLKSAFTDLYAAHADSEVTEAHCGLGSVKTNIGHLELAAGVAGVIKVLLQLKHQTLVKSLHCEQVNPYIQLQGSPFYLVNEMRPWAARKDASGRVLPRRAGVSSFGFGGVNAHVIIEEYCVPQSNALPPVAITADLPALIVLSAKSEDRLREQAKQLLAHISHHSYAEADLGNIAYTLQVGREAMDHRLALAAVTIADAKESLRGYVEGKWENGAIGSCYRGEVKKNKDVLSALSTDEDASGLLRTWLEKGKYSKLLELWVSGLSLDWAVLYEQGSAYAALEPRRISLPTYAFAKERYWPGDMNSAQEHVKNESGNSVGPVAIPPRFQKHYALPKNALMAREYWQESPQLLDEDILRTRAVGKGPQRVLVLYRRLPDLEMLSKALLHYWQGFANKLLIESLRIADVRTVEELLGSHLATNVAPDVVFYVPGIESVDAPSPESEGRACFTQDRRLLGEGELELLFAIAQTLIRRAGTKSLDLHHCYAQCRSVANIYREGLAGLFRAIAMECPSHRYRNIACTRLADLSDYKGIVSEWLAASSAQQIPVQVPELSYREGKRYATRFSEWQPGLSELTNSSPFRPGATYLMVGALGEVGLRMCLALAQEFKPRLIVLSRRPDNRVQDPYLDSALSRLEQAGAQVLYRSVDITDAEKVAEVFKDVKAAVGAIHGVVHFARTVEDGPLHDKTFPAFRETIAAKVVGTLNIDKVTADEPLEFFIVFSSMAAFGIAGSPDYGYATAFQNAFVRDRNRKLLENERQGASIAFCWGQWAADAYSNRDRDAALKGMGFDFIDASFALHTMAIALHELQADLKRPGINDRLASDVLGAMAVNDRESVKQLYGLAADDGPADLGSKTTYPIKLQANAGADDLSVDDLVALSERLDGNDDAIRSSLLDRSYSQLNRLYESLITHS